MPSSLRSMAEALWNETQKDDVGKDLGEWVIEQRTAGATWRAISADLRERTGAAIDLPQQTLVNWFGDREREPAA